MLILPNYEKFKHKENVSDSAWLLCFESKDKCTNPPFKNSVIRHLL